MGHPEGQHHMDLVLVWLSQGQSVFPLCASQISHLLEDRLFLQGRLISTDLQAVIRRQYAISPASSLASCYLKERHGEGVDAVLNPLLLPLRAVTQNRFRRDGEKITPEGGILCPSGCQHQAGSRSLSSGSKNTAIS